MRLRVWRQSLDVLGVRWMRVHEVRERDGGGRVLGAKRVLEDAGLRTFAGRRKERGVRKA